MRPLKLALAIMAAVMIVSCAWGLKWLVGTEDGIRWLMERVSRHSQVRIGADRVEGRLADRLLLGGVRITLPMQQVEVDSLELSWKPLLLLSGMLGISDLTLRGVRVQDNSPTVTRPPDLLWPRPAGLARLFDARVAHLQLQGLRYRRLQGAALILNAVSGELAWQDQQLIINDLKADAPDGRLSGSIRAGFQRPALSADVAVVPSRPLAGLENISLQLRMSDGQQPEQLVGRVVLVSSRRVAGKEQRMELSGEAGMTRTVFNLRKLNLTASGLRGMITAEGNVNLAALEPQLSLRIQTDRLDLLPLLKVPTDLKGTLSLEGGLSLYHGKLAVANRGRDWRTAHVSADYQGNASGIKLTSLTGLLLDGTLQGGLEADWSHGISLRTQLKGRGLNPAHIAPDWTGVVNFDLNGSLIRIGQADQRGTLAGSLLESRLHGQSLTGGVDADFSAEDVIVRRLDLQGRGFTIHGAGELNRRLSVMARVDDLSRLVPGTHGEVRAEGWLAWRGQRPSGAVTVHGSVLAMDDARMAGADLTARLEEGRDYSLLVSGELRQVAWGRFQADRLSLQGDGIAVNHRISVMVSTNGNTARLALSGGYAQGVWSGKVIDFSGHDSVGSWSLAAPAALTADGEHLALSLLSLTGSGAERLELAADLRGNPLRGVVHSRWIGLNLARGSEWLQDLKMSGASTGSMRLNLLPGERLELSSAASLQGTFTTAGRSVTVQRGDLTATAGERGLQGSVQLQLANGAALQAKIASAAPARLELPDQGVISLELKELDLALLKPWLPADLRLDGRLNGRAAGRLLPGQRFELEGSSAIGQGKLRWERPEGELSVELSSASSTWNWRGEALRGSFVLDAAKTGQLRGSFQLPLAGRLPLAVNSEGAVQATLNGQLQENGLLAALFPDILQESLAKLDLDLKIGGRWADPQPFGTLRLSGAGAYLPSAGIHVKDVELTARLEKNLLLIDSFRALSGAGSITGTAQLRLAGARVAGFSGTLKGDRFQTVYFPEFQVQCSPQLTFEGTPQKLVVRGELHLPEFSITGPPAKKAVTASGDVILEGKPRVAAKRLPWELDAQVRLVLGERVFVKLEGIDAQLGGSIDLTMHSLDRVSSRGEIKVIKGRYQTYGVNLEIVRGRLFYPDSPLNQPTMDILAVRTMGDVRAGVIVSGTLEKPLIKLYSEPAMPDVDILSYVVQGRPLGGGSTEQVDMMTRAAGMLLSSSQSRVLQDQIKSRLGLSTLEVQSGGRPSAGYMGYKPIQVTPGGSTPVVQSGGVSQTMVTVGKYLTPELYFSYGRSIFTGGNLFLLRYDFFKKWQIETQSGINASGVDLYYKIEFK